MGLEKINNGDLADADVVNDNFTYLDNRISTFGDSISNLQSNISTLNVNLSNRINAVDTKVSVEYTTLDPSGTIALETNSLNTITPTGAVVFTLPAVSTSKELNQILVQINLETVYSINVGTTHFFNSKTPDLSTIGKYDLIYEYDEKNDYWVVGWMRKS